MPRPRLGVLLSGSGRTLQNLIDQIAAGSLTAEIACVISDRAEVLGLRRATDAGLAAFHQRASEPIWALLRRHRVDLVCLCGYLRLLPIAPDFHDRVLNIHPSLLPAFGGQGCYGERVHQAVLAAGVAESGCTVHLCTDQYDRGPIVLQQRVPVLPGDTPHLLADRVFQAECQAYPAAIARYWQTLTATSGPPAGPPADQPDGQPGD